VGQLEQKLVEDAAGEEGEREREEEEEEEEGETEKGREGKRDGSPIKTKCKRWRCEQ